jgi:hypothetical protein
VLPIRRTQKSRDIPLYKKANWDTLAQEMQRVDDEIKQMHPHATANDKWIKFRDALQQGIKTHIPTKTCKKKDSLPYMNKELERLIKRRDRMYKKRKKAQRNFEYSTTNYQDQDRKYRDLKHQVQKKMREAYWNHVESIITPMDPEDPHKGMKRFWTFVKSLRKDYSGVAPLKDQGRTCTENTEKANILNKQFESVFTRESDIPPNLLPETSPYEPMQDITISQQGVLKLLTNLNIYKAPGPDNISPRVLKNLAPSISPILADIFTTSYESGEVPEDWKQANVSPIFKKGNKGDAANYRPISLTCVCCKIMEHIITSNIMKHAKNQNILYEFQHGFRDQRSCETQLLEFVHDIVCNMQQGKQTDVLVMDFSKAFDKVGHQRLLHKLHHYGIQGNTNNWIRGFLTGRSQTVVLDGENSYRADVLSGVPQGSVLGPCLFLFYINDMPNNTSSRIRLFADDTIAYLAINNTNDAMTLQADLNQLGTWEKLWQMEFHPGKCQVLSITRNRKTINHQYQLHGHTLEHVKEAKYLGVTITSDLRWNKHINNISAKANRTLGFLKRNIRIRSQTLKETAYKTLVRPSVEYASTVWDPCHLKPIKQLEMVQRRSARYVLRRHNNTSSVTDMLSELGWSSLQERRQHQRLSMMYKIHHGLVGIQKDRYCTPPARKTRSAPHAYIIPSSTREYHSMSFFPRTIREWNILPAVVAEAPTLTTFKTRMSGPARRA